MPLISIIIPVYNVERFLPKCLDSIIAQTFTDFEVILVDDGSVDRSGNVCDSYAQRDCRLRVIHQTNGGVSSARNRGLDMAIGEYICFVDSDDWIDPTFLDDFKVTKYYADLYISGALYDIDNMVYSYKKYEAFFIDDRKAIGKEFSCQNIWQNGYPWGKLYRSEIIMNHNLRFNEELSIHEDHLFLFEYQSHIESIYITDTAGYHYLVIDESKRKLSSRKNSYDELIQVAERFNSVLFRLIIHLQLNNGDSKLLFDCYVVEMRLRALSNLFITESKCRYNKYCVEAKYWQKYVSLHDVNFVGYQKLLIDIIIKVKYISLSYIFVSIISFIKSKRPYNIMELILQDLASRSTVC